ERIHGPYSYLYPVSSFPHDIEIWDRSGTVVHTIAKLPLEDKVPIEGVPTGPRNVHWRPTAPGTLVWVEALDDGDPKKKGPFLDRLNLTTLETERLFHCGEQQYEVPVALLSDDGRTFLTRHETPTDPPNVYVRTPGSGDRRALTHFTDPTPQIRGISKRLVT